MLQIVGYVLLALAMLSALFATLFIIANETAATRAFVMVEFLTGSAMLSTAGFGLLAYVAIADPFYRNFAAAVFVLFEFALLPAYIFGRRCNRSEVAVRRQRPRAHV